MPGLRLFTSNRLEVLVGELSKTLRRPLASPVVPEIILVQSRGMERWLSLELARRLGICSNIRFPFPNHFVEEVFRGVLPDRPAGDTFDPDVLPWRIMGDLPGCLNGKGFESLEGYLAGDGRGLKRYELSRNIARLFDQYLIYRPDTVLRWESGRDHHWQAILWRRLAAEHPGSHRAARWKAALERLEQSLPGSVNLPGRISVFGISALPPYHLQVLAAVSRFIDVNLFVMNPCREYWYLIYSDREMQRIADRLGTARSDEALHLERGNSLLASMGALGRDFLRMVCDTGCEEADVSVEPGEGSLLSRIQSDILNLRDRGADGIRSVVAEGDDSVQIHSCHSPMREVEVLQDRILDLLERDPRLMPADVLVMMPDVETHAPFIEAVFSLPRDDRRRIPFSVADRGVRKQSVIVDTFLRLLDLEGSRMGVTEVTAFLEADALRKRFALEADDLVLIRRWIRNTGIRWGIDRESRTREGLPDFAENSWQAGIDRLLLGYALPGRGEGLLFMGILPLEGISEGETAVLGSFLAFTNNVFAFAMSLEEPRDLSGWASHLGAALDNFFLPDGEEEEELQAVRRALGDMARKQVLSEFDEKIGVGVLRAHLEETLREVGFGFGFLTGGVTFCAMLPMRSIPFKVICLIGLDDDAYPRQTRVPGFDLMKDHPRPGDRSRRTDDRYLFLEALLSARERIYISYTGQSIQDNSMRPPSVLVSELLDCIEQGFEIPDRIIRDEIVTKHRLQAFSPDYFRGGGLFSYSAENKAAAVSAVADRREKPPFIAGSLPDPDPAWKTVDIHALTRFYANPARTLLIRRLGIRLDEEEVLLDDVEPMNLEGLDRYGLGELLTDRCLKGIKTRELLPAARALGILPPGTPGECLFEDLCSGVDAFADRLRPHLTGESLGAVDLDLALGSFRLTGRIDGGLPAALVHYRFASVRTKDLLRAWIHHLVLSLGGAGRYSGRCVLLGQDAEHVFGPVERAEGILRGLLDHYWMGLKKPLHFFPETSRAYTEALRKGKTEEEARKVARNTWSSDYGFAERDDPYYRLCFGEEDPLDVEFQDLAELVLRPVLESMQGEGG